MKQYYYFLSISDVTSEYACSSVPLTLSCSNARIFIESSHYGQNFPNCNDTCCVPTTKDCTESLQENSPSDWSTLKNDCDGQASCEFANPMKTLTNCEAPYESDYIQVYHSCVPGKVNFCVSIFIIGPILRFPIVVSYKQSVD